MYGTSFRRIGADRDPCRRCRRRGVDPRPGADDFLIGLVIIILILTGIFLAVTNIRVAIAGALVLAAFALLLSNLLGYLRRR